MTTTIRVARGLCSPLRDDVLTAIEPFGVRVLNITAWGEGHWHIPGPDWMTYPDADIWVRKHICDVTVSDAQAAWAERLLWKSGKCDLESKPLNPSLKWNAPAECKEGAHALRSRGERYKPWSEQESKSKTRAKRQPRQRRNKRSRQSGGILDTLTRLFR